MCVRLGMWPSCKAAAVRPGRWCREAKEWRGERCRLSELLGASFVASRPGRGRVSLVRDLKGGALAAVVNNWNGFFLILFT